MHPALSVIFFTVVSGCGYGILFLLGVALAINPLLVARGEALTTLVIGLLFAAAGLTSSMLHLGQPQRAWRALSQWRSSWLSREGVTALCSFVPSFALGVCLWRGDEIAALRGFGALLAVLAVITVCCTAKIYTSLKTIPAWHNRYVLPGYLLFALLGGAAWLFFLHGLFVPALTNLQEMQANLPAALSHMIMRFVLAALVLSAALFGILWKFLYWRFIDAMEVPSTTESATGLGRFGKVRSVEQPHTEENYLTHEMGFVLARKHASRLRGICLVLFAAASLLALLGIAMAASTCTIVTAVCITAGIFIERWLFFAEAKHVVMLYYRADAPV